MPPKKKQNKNDFTMEKKEFITYYKRKAYKFLKYTPNPSMDKKFQEFEIDIEKDGDKINLKDFIEETVIPTQSFYDRFYTNGWIEQLYNLHLPRNFKNFKSLKIQDIKDGKHKKTADDKTYLSTVLNLELVEDEKDDLTTLDFLITREKELIPSLFDQAENKQWTLATLNGYLKAIRHWYVIMLESDKKNHELRIKYSVLYGGLDHIIQESKNTNVASGNEVAYMRDLYKLVDDLDDEWKAFYDENFELKNPNDKNLAFKKHMDYLAVMIMVYDPPSRSDKYDTIIIDDRKEAKDKKTYLWIEGDKMMWIYKKDVKDIGRSEVEVPILNMYEGDQEKFKQAIKLSLKKFPRKYLFIPKNTNWKSGNPVIKKSADPTSVSEWVLNIKKRYPNWKTKQLGINLFRRSFVSHWLDKLNQIDKRRMVWSMLTSFQKVNSYYTRKFTSVELKKKVKLEYESPDEDDTIHDISNDDDQPNNRAKQVKKGNKIPIPKESNVIQEPQEQKKQPDSGAERQRKYYAKNKGKEDFQARRKKIETAPYRHLKRILSELNRTPPLKFFDGILQTTKDKYELKETMKNGKKHYSSDILDKYNSSKK